MFQNKIRLRKKDKSFLDIVRDNPVKFIMAAVCIIWFMDLATADIKTFNVKVVEKVYVPAVDSYDSDNSTDAVIDLHLLDLDTGEHFIYGTTYEKFMLYEVGQESTIEITVGGITGRRY